MNEIKPAILMFILFTVVCGGIYPAVVTGVAQAVFPKQARGSLISDKSGKVTGSALIGQPFTSPSYFWPRPSATSNFGYNPLGSGGSNSGPTNPDFIKTVRGRVKALHDTGIAGNIPVDLVEASASGLDPHISPEAANVQIPRVAKARGMSQEEVSKLIVAHTSDRQLGFLGEPRVNVLELNLKLDALK